MSVRTLTQPLWLLSALLIAGAALFTIGIAAERHATAHNESGTELTSPATTAPPTATTRATSSDADGGETSQTTVAKSDADGGEATAHTEAPVGEATGHSETSGETVLGLNLESNALVAVAVIISLVLAALTWLRSRRGMLLATVAFALVLAVFDVAEVAHQIKESRAGLATLAAAIAVVHLVTAVVAQQRAAASS